MGKEISLCNQQLGKQLGGCKQLLSVFKWNQKNYVYYQYHRRAESAVPESDKNKKCISQWHFPGKNAVSGIRKHHEEMDTAISWMGSGIGTVNRFIWWTSNTIPVKKNESGTHYTGITTLILFLRHWQYIHKYPFLFLRPGLGRAQIYGIYVNVYLLCKNFQNNVYTMKNRQYYY